MLVPQCGDHQPVHSWSQHKRTAAPSRVVQECYSRATTSSWTGSVREFREFYACVHVQLATPADRNHLLNMLSYMYENNVLSVRNRTDNVLN